MTLHAVDLALVGALLAVLAVAGLACRRYARSVSGFLAANRCADRYLLSVAYNMAQLGVITLVWYFQQNYDVGYTSIWWQLMEGPALIVIALTGWVIYRFRRTRALTLAQFFEMRYSRSFRVFAGLVAFLAGILNYGIFPGVAARFFIALCGLPGTFPVAGHEIETFPVVMAALLSLALFFVFVGGQIAVMVTDFLQGVFGHLVFLGVVAFLLWTFPWEHLSAVLLGQVWDGAAASVGNLPPEGTSLIHPFKIQNEENFNVWYWVISVVVLFYGARGWQGDQGYNAAARNAHEARMANILNGWRFRVLMLIVVVLPVCIRTVMHHPAYREQALAVEAALAGAPTEALRAELRTPYAIAVMLPAGLLGLMTAAMLGAFVSTNDTYLHSWGAIFIQDVVLPFRRRPLAPRTHLRLLRLTILGVAVFAFLFSYFYEPNQYIAMFLALTGAVFVGGAGSAIIGGLYWKRGTTAAAWTAMVLGMSLSGYGIVVKQPFAGPWLEAGLGLWWSPLARTGVFLSGFTGQELTFWAIAISAASYVVVSLCGRRAYDLDRLLHRGPYEVEENRVAEPASRRPAWLRKLGFDEEYTGTDQWVAVITLAWPLVWTLVFLVFTAYNLVVDVPDRSWLRYWHWWTWGVWGVGLCIMVWFTAGGFRDLARLFRRLRAYEEDTRDDGRVEAPGD